MPVVTLPNGMVVDTPNKHETAFLYHELFEANGYLQHGVTVDDGACLLDVGANVGLFSASLAQRHRDLRLVLFEPVPYTYAMLKRNAERHLTGAQATLVQAAVSSSPGRGTFEFSSSWTFGAGPPTSFATSRAAIAEHANRPDGSSGTAPSWPTRSVPERYPTRPRAA
jgi:FkbM family methyltransferase